LGTFPDNAAAIKRRAMSSELDVHTFMRNTLEGPVEEVIGKMQSDDYLSKYFDIKGSVEFENHTKTLTRSEDVVDAAAKLSLADRPAADQYCVYKTEPGGKKEKVAVFVSEYKAPHKLPSPQDIEQGLELLDKVPLKEIMTPKPTDNRMDRLRVSPQHSSHNATIISL
jgi:hypothetical protein